MNSVSESDASLSHNSSYSSCELSDKSDACGNGSETHHTPVNYTSHHSSVSLPLSITSEKVRAAATA